MKTDMRAASWRSARMTESTVRCRHFMLCLLLQTVALGLVVTGGWCVSPPPTSSGRWTIRSEAVVSNGGLCHLQAPGRRNDSSAEVQPGLRAITTSVSPGQSQKIPSAERFASSARTSPAKSSRRSPNRCGAEDEREK